MNENRRYVQYGCGMCAPDGWENFDSSPTLRFEKMPLVGMLYTKNASRFPRSVRYGNIVKGLPVPQESCDGVYCSHVLEHLSLDECRVALKNTYRLLKPGGVFRLVVPDLRAYASRFVEDPTAEAAVAFMRDTNLGRVPPKRGVRSFIVDWLGRVPHLWMWDYRSLEAEVLAAGFVMARRADCGDAEDQHFGAVEDPDRWHDAFGLECRRPEESL